MSLAKISALKAKQLIDEGAVLIDIRGAGEHARERIPGALNQSISGPIQTGDASLPVIFHCRTGHRTTANAPRLASTTSCEAFILEGGLNAWRQAGLPVEKDASQPIEIQRQVQITAGALMIISLLLGFFVTPAFYGLSAFVAMGLIVAGVTGWCGMTNIFANLPWNRKFA